MRARLSDFEVQRREQKDLKFALPKYNFTMTTGEDSRCMKFHLNVKKTRLNKVKWWLFCKVFPFRITQWEEMK